MHPVGANLLTLSMNLNISMTILFGTDLPVRAVHSRGEVEHE